jgi:hypothetical protein
MNEGARFERPRCGSTGSRGTNHGSLLRGALILVVLVGVGVPPAPTQARTSYTTHIPNGAEFGCGICHDQEPLLNNFGWDTGLTLPMGRVEWSLIWNLDSDGDGQTNGFELGDPCGNWVRGGEDPEREDDLSDPSLADAMVPSEIPEPECPSADDDDSAIVDDDDSAEPEPEACGYSLAAATGQSPMGLVFGVFAVLSLLLVSRRRS